MAASSLQKLSKCVARSVPGQKYVESRVQLKLRPTAGDLNFYLSSGCKCEDDEEVRTTTWKEFGPGRVASLAGGFKVYLS